MRKRVVDLMPSQISAEAKSWAESMGTDVRAAWDTCPKIMWLTLLARGIGVPSKQLTKILLYGAPEHLLVVQDPSTHFERAMAEYGARPQSVLLAEHAAALARMRATIDIDAYIAKLGAHRGRVRRSAASTCEYVLWAHATPAASM